MLVYFFLCSLGPSDAVFGLVVGFPEKNPNFEVLFPNFEVSLPNFDCSANLLICSRWISPIYCPISRFYCI